MDCRWSDRLPKIAFLGAVISLVCLGLASESGAQEKRSRFRSGTEVRGQTNATPKAAPKRSQIKNYSKKYNVVEEDGKKVLYKKRNVVEFDGSMIEGEIRNPNDFYFVHRPEENFGSLLQKRKNFHKEMLRDTVMIR